MGQLQVNAGNPRRFEDLPTVLWGSRRTFFELSTVQALARAQQWAQTYLVSVPKKPQDSVALYQHRIRVDHSSVRKLQEVIATVEALKQQRSTTSDD
jgi:hypothetical protein